MQDSIYRFSLDIHSTQSQVSIPVPQFNTARSIMATLTEGGKPYTLSDECRAVFTAIKADGTTVYNDCLILNGSVIRYDFTEQTVAAEGVADCAIKIFGANNKLLTSPRFSLVVYEDIGNNIVPSESEMNILNGIMTKEADRAEAEIKRAEAEKARENTVYIGSDEPPASTKIWLDPNGKPTGSGQAVLRIRQPDGSWAEVSSLVGPKGEKGEQGNQGMQGLQGPQGDQGPQGIQGLQGIQGPVGPIGPQGKQGEPFSVAKVYESVAAMNAGYGSDGVKVGELVVVNTGNVEDEENARLYIKGNTAYDYLTDLSGAQGIQGPQGPQGPQGEPGATGAQGPAGDVGSYLNRTTAVNAADTNYTTYMARGTSLNAEETSPTVNGTIAWHYK